MPTIDQLTSAVAASDEDLLPISQGGVTRSITRALFLADTQTAIALGQGLLGRASASVGAPEPIKIGGGLTLVNGTLTCPAAFSIGQLPPAIGINATDQLALLQGGEQVAITASTLVSVAGADASGHAVIAPSGNARKLSDWLTDSLAVEAFGAVGDGVTDDTSAFNRAIASGRPVRLGAKAYRIDGQWTISSPCVLLGSPGQSVLRRGQQAGGAWINVTGSSFTAIGVTFDAASVSTDSWGVLIGSACMMTSLSDCVFMNALGPTLGCGLTLEARLPPTNGSECHTIRNCVFTNNKVHGIWVQAATHVLVEGCAAFGNGAYGICLDFNDPTFQRKIVQSAVISCRAWANQRGISVGNFNETNLQPPTWGLANPDALEILVAANICENNTAYGLAVSGERIRVRSNQVTTGAATQSGILFNASDSTLDGNGVQGGGQFGIDAGGCASCEISDNSVDGFSVGINAGGGTAVRVLGNRLVGNNRAITIFQVETDGNGNNFGLSCRDVWVDRNFIDLSAGGAGGVLLFDGPQNISLTNNDFYTGSAPVPVQTLAPLTNTVTIAGNRINGLSKVVCDSTAASGGVGVVMPDFIDGGIVPATIGQIVSLAGALQSTLTGQVTFILVTDQGSGYTVANVAISGGGTGATARAYIRNGAIIGIAMTAGGSGYAISTTAAVIAGDGTGASLAVNVGAPVPTGRTVKLRCEGQVVFAAPQLSSWVGPSFTVPAGSEVTLNGVSGNWEAVAFTSLDFVQPTSDGSLTLRSLSGDLRLLPGGGGQLRYNSTVEPIGCVSCIGRGSPEGVVTAPPGSDYRNLDGGVGTTLWLKQTGFDKNGWAVIG